MKVFQLILQHVVENPAARFTFQGFQQLLGLPDAAAQRILTRLVSAGLVDEVQRGLWARTWAHVWTRRRQGA